MFEIQRTRLDATVFIEQQHVPAGVVFGCQMAAVRGEVLRLDCAVLQINTAAEALHVGNKHRMLRVVGFDAPEYRRDSAGRRREEYDALARGRNISIECFQYELVSLARRTPLGGEF